jgi:hypothetical protein
MMPTNSYNAYELFIDAMIPFSAIAMLDLILSPTRTAFLVFLPPLQMSSTSARLPPPFLRLKRLRADADVLGGL